MTNNKEQETPQPAQTFTERQQKLIDYCKSKGHGWEKFAASVEEQGWCSPAQEETLDNMAHRLVKGPVRKKKYRRAGGDIDDDRSDYEAMSTGEYF